MARIIGNVNTPQGYFFFRVKAFILSDNSKTFASFSCMLTFSLCNFSKMSQG